MGRFAKIVKSYSSMIRGWWGREGLGIDGQWIECRIRAIHFDVCSSFAFSCKVDWMWVSEGDRSRGSRSPIFGGSLAFRFPYM